MTDADPSTVAARLGIGQTHGSAPCALEQGRDQPPPDRAVAETAMDAAARFVRRIARG